MKRPFTNSMLYRAIFVCFLTGAGVVLFRAFQEDHVVVVSARPVAASVSTRPPDPALKELVATCDGDAGTRSVSIRVYREEKGFELEVSWSGGDSDDIAALGITNPGTSSMSWVAPFDEFLLGHNLVWKAGKRGTVQIRFAGERTGGLGIQECNVAVLIVPGPVHVAWGPRSSYPRSHMKNAPLPPNWKEQPLGPEDLSSDPLLVTSRNNREIQFPKIDVLRTPAAADDDVWLLVPARSFEGSWNSSTGIRVATFWKLPA